MAFWSVVQTEPQREQVAAYNLRAAGFEIYLPRIRVMRGARSRIVPLFPGYLFVEIDAQWWSVRWTVGVVRVLMADSAPAKVSREVVVMIREREDDEGLVQLPQAPGLSAGDAVKVAHGLFEGQIGIYQGTSGASRARILLALLGREVSVLLRSVDVESIKSIKPASKKSS
jgi:transcription antitermination factor NusG